MNVGRTGIEPVTSCLSSKRSKPTELTSRFSVGKSNKNQQLLTMIRKIFNRLTIRCGKFLKFIALIFHY